MPVFRHSSSVITPLDVLTIATIIQRLFAPDKTTKLLLRFPDRGTVEAVHMPSYTKAGATLCVSTQIGCPVGCPFCASVWSCRAALTASPTSGPLHGLLELQALELKYL